jgi:hypothetical protein
MASLHEYFQNDFKELSIEKELTINYIKTDTKTRAVVGDHLLVKQRLQQYLAAASRVFVFYIALSEDTILACVKLLQDLDKWKSENDRTVIYSSLQGENHVGPILTNYSNVIYIYCEKQLSDSELVMLEKSAQILKYHVVVRSQNYVSERNLVIKPFGFISHDSRDKETIARPLAYGLSSRLCHVWFDEFSLKVGQSLRESIEKGIKEAKRCILIITPHFLDNTGWTKQEFDSIFTREIVKEEKIVIPVWYNVSKTDVYEYSPSLTNKMALIWPSKEGSTEEQYTQKIESIISSIHCQISTD